MASIFTLRNTPAVLARIPLHPAEEDSSDVTVGDGLFGEAMFMASRQAGVAACLGRPGELSRREVTRRAYELRARWRPTPHGAFAGVATARIAEPGQAAELRLGGDHLARTSPSGAWLAAVADLVLSDMAVLPRLRFTASNLVIHRGNLLECEWRTRRVTVRATEASLLILHVCACGGGAGFARIADAVIGRWPVPEPVLHATLIHLVRGGFLLTDLLPPDISDDPLAHILQRLPGGHTLAGPLARLRRLLTKADRRPVGHPMRRETLVAARDLADDICLTDRPLNLDVAAEARLVLAQSVLNEAAWAAGALWKASDVSVSLAGWHHRFTERYGPDRLVPLLEATDAVVGLGINTTALEAASSDEAVAGSPRRIRVLSALVAETQAHGSIEVVIDNTVLNALGDDHLAQPPRTAELGVRVIAENHHALAAGKFRLAVVPPCSDDAGSTIGRFARLLPDAWPGKPETDPTPLIAEIATQARVAEGSSLAPPTGFTRWRIPVGVPACEGDLHLGDLHLLSDGKRLWCWSARHNRPIIPILYSRLTPAMLPPIARFLQLLGNAGNRPLHPWSWGALAHSPFQPRIRYRNTILTPARWVLPLTLTETATDRDRWNHELDLWRTTTPPPPAVIVTDDGDHRLPLDLRHDTDRELLRRYVRRGLIAVCEPPGGPDAVQAAVTGPTGRHVLELVVPLQTRIPEPATPQPARLVPPVRGGAEGLFLPGGPWLSLTIRAPLTCQDQVLTQLAHLSGNLAEHLDMWFWLRYADPGHGPHLRVRFHGGPADLGGIVLPALSAWCGKLIQQRLSGGFSIDPYDQEIERYGGPDSSMNLAEQVFAADSRFALDVLTTTGDPDRRLTIAAASAAAIARTIADGDATALGRHRLDRAARQRFETLRPHIRAIRPLRDPATAPDIVAAADAWKTRQESMMTYRATLKPDQRRRCAASLIHMHANRLLGDATAESIAAALAADLLTRPVPPP